MMGSIKQMTEEWDRKSEVATFLCVNGCRRGEVLEHLRIALEMLSLYLCRDTRREGWLVKFSETSLHDQCSTSFLHAHKLASSQPLTKTMTTRGKVKEPSNRLMTRVKRAKQFKWCDGISGGSGVPTSLYLLFFVLLNVNRDPPRWLSG